MEIEEDNQGVEAAPGNQRLVLVEAQEYKIQTEGNVGEAESQGVKGEGTGGEELQPCEGVVKPVKGSWA